MGDPLGVGGTTPAGVDTPCDGADWGLTSKPCNACSKTHRKIDTAEACSATSGGAGRTCVGACCLKGISYGLAPIITTLGHRYA